ncbi:EamA family transporter [Planctomicrobium piriforme]|uniref:Uncharacterized membrane protein n=1 Tax=Planctomicrobium piriforme TaxID=1576369 RepID=A0A1I3LRT0_9PLAN|nr:EamA family transporter [Planctomicrobium piriforme]SFI87478.1 Uncharacterized membrane protein [Planctomicrobium piriforme]
MPNDPQSSSHLLLPLLASLLFVVGALFGKASSVRGASPYTNTFAANFCLALFWTAFGFARSGFLPPAAWAPAAAIACAFVVGQLCTYLAFQNGDVSLATPIFGVKIILVAVLVSLLAEEAIPTRIWIAAILASIGVAVVQMNPGQSKLANFSARRTALTVVLALLAATSYSLFDVGLQYCGRKYGGEAFLATMFVWMGLISCGLLPWTDSLTRLRQIKAVTPLLMTALLIAGQAVLICYALGQYGDATRVNIIYALRGLWSVLLAWILNRMAVNPEGRHSARTMLFRLTGAAILLACVIISMT